MSKEKVKKTRGMNKKSSKDNNIIGKSHKESDQLLFHQAHRQIKIYIRKNSMNTKQSVRQKIMKCVLDVAMIIVFRYSYGETIIVFKKK